MTKRILAGFLCLVLLFTAVPVTAFAANTGEGAAVDTEAVSIEGTNGFGNLLTQEITQSQLETDEESANYEAGYTVTDLTIEGTTATVTYDSMEEALLVVALYTEDGLRMVTSATAAVTADATEATVEFTDEMPEYFLASAYLVDIYDLSPLCAAYDTPMYTREMQELLASTVEDYDADRVLNLDDDNTTNFAVYADTTKVIDPIEGVNTVTSIDDENAAYVIENADAQITSLVTGDVFVYPYAENELLIVKVAEITADGSTVAITGTEITLEEVFSYMKIENGSSTSDIAVDDSTAAEGISYAGLEEEEGNISPQLWWEGSGKANVSHVFKIEIKEERKTEYVDTAVSVTGSLKIQMEVSLKFYISTTRQFLEFKAVPSVKVSVNLKGNVTGKYPIGEFQISPVFGVYVGFEPELQLEFSGEMGFTLEYSMTFGISYSNDRGLIDLTTKPKDKLDMSMEGKVFFWYRFCSEGQNCQRIYRKAGIADSRGIRTECQNVRCRF